jgi:hypothetical protein
MRAQQRPLLEQDQDLSEGEPMSQEGEGGTNPGIAGQRDDRYFVTVYVHSRAQVGRVMRYGLDLFEESVREEEEEGRVAVDGLLTLTEAGRLVDDGHQVLLIEEASKRARAHLDASEFEEWLQNRRRQ